MKRKALSAPEAVLHFYISQYADKDATLNEVSISKDGKTYTADITCNVNGVLYDVEFDSQSGHDSEAAFIKDVRRNEVFASNGYKIIRMRNTTKTKVMPLLPNVKNIPIAFNSISKRIGSFPTWEIKTTEEGIREMFIYMGINRKDINIDIERDYNYILEEYFPEKTNWRRISKPYPSEIKTILSWNCSGAFRKKYDATLQSNADVLVISECENPEKHHFSLAGYRYIWTGTNENKGIAVFAKSNLALHKLSWITGPLQLFLPVAVDGLPIVGVWANKPYIEEFYVWLQLNYEKITKDTILIGDFNSNAIWDYKHGKRNHTEVLNHLSEKGLVSAYHALSGENQGKESEYTFFQYRHQDKGYHIDYAFCNRNKIDDFKVLPYKDWYEYSDHAPLLLTINS